MRYPCGKKVGGSVYFHELLLIKEETMGTFFSQFALFRKLLMTVPR